MFELNKNDKLARIGYIS